MRTPPANPHLTTKLVSVEMMMIKTMRCVEVMMGRRQIVRVQILKRVVVRNLMIWRRKVTLKAKIAIILWTQAINMGSGVNLWSRRI